MLDPLYSCTPCGWLNADARPSGRPIAFNRGFFAAYANQLKGEEEEGAPAGRAGENAAGRLPTNPIAQRIYIRIWDALPGKRGWFQTTTRPIEYYVSRGGADIVSSAIGRIGGISPQSGQITVNPS